MTQQDDTQRGKMAAAILGNPVFEEAFTLLKEGYLQAVMAAKTDQDLRDLRRALQAIHTMRLHWQTVLNKGAISQHDVETLMENPNVFKRAIRKLA